VVSSKLEPYGWFVAPFIVGTEFDRIEGLTKTIDKNPPADANAKKRYRKKIYLALVDVAYSPQVRARYVWLALQAPKFNEYSHLYECAIFSYFKREYPAAIALLLIALEGVVRALHGWKLGQPGRLTFKQLITTITNIPPTNFNADLNEVRDM
jgi:hypothetical protein